MKTIEAYESEDGRVWKTKRLAQDADEAIAREKIAAWFDRVTRVNDDGDARSLDYTDLTPPNLLELRKLIDEALQTFDAEQRRKNSGL